MYVPRLQTARLKDLFRTFPVVVVAGARQVGKSTLVRKVFGERADCVVFDPVQDVENARRDPDLFLDHRSPPLILDEIQYAPEVVAALKRRIDRDRKPGQYVLTGSQQWGVLRSLTESLAGRAVFLDLEGFCVAEVARAAHPRAWLERFLDDPTLFLGKPHRRRPLPRSLYEQIWRGWLPEAQRLPLRTVPDFHAGYIRTYVERDVRLLADVSDLQLFGRFVRLVAALTAQEINFSHLGRELGVTPQTSRRWLDVLKGTFQWFEVPAYHTSAARRATGRPKGHLADTGLACAAQVISTPLALGSHPLLGSLFETAVASEIRKQLSVLSPRPNLYHWRAFSGSEVDLVLERDGILCPIEVKAAAHPSGADARGIRAFREAYPRQRIGPGLVIAPTERVYPLTDRDYAIPWDLEA
ncbi:MAG: ATP-binding protein [Planctomycetes bacterium]|nr:ATP-binding protein [Planctomycetota bacterium]